MIENGSLFILLNIILCNYFFNIQVQKKAFINLKHIKNM